MARRPPPARGDDTRDALLRAATAIFGRDGFDAASTRAIARAAGVNQALIGYHFGGKEGLYLAVFDAIATRMQRELDPLSEEIAALGGDDADATFPRARRVELLHRLVAGFAALLTSAETADWARLIMREQQAPSAAFELLYDRIMGRVLGLLRHLVAGIRGTHPDSVDTRLAAFAIIGQVLVFRVAHAAVLRQLEWRTIGAPELHAIQSRLRCNIDALLAGGTPA